MSEREAVSVGELVVFRRTVVVAEHLFVKVAVQMEWLNRNVGSAQGPLEQTPEVLDALRVD